LIQERKIRMPRRILTTASIAVVIAVAIGSGAAPAAGGPCALLTANDVTAVLGMPVKGVDAGDSEECMYASETQDSAGEQATVTLRVHGGRADFDQSVSMAQQYGMPYTPLSGLGDKAYENNKCGEQCATVGVIKGKAYFTVMVQEDLNHSRSAVALARNIADRIK
jgi:hypothetical protein